MIKKLIFEEFTGAVKMPPFNTLGLQKNSRKASTFQGGGCKAEK